MILKTDFDSKWVQYSSMSLLAKIPDVSVFTVICVSLPSTFSLFVFCPCTFFAAFCCLAKSCFPMGLNIFSVAETPTDLPGIQFAQILDPYGSRFSDRFRMWIGSETSHFVHRSYMECCNCGEAYHNRSMVFLSFPKVFQMKLLRIIHSVWP